MACLLCFVDCVFVAEYGAISRFRFIKSSLVCSSNGFIMSRGAVFRTYILIVYCGNAMREYLTLSVSNFLLKSLTT